MSTRLAIVIVTLLATVTSAQQPGRSVASENPASALPPGLAEATDETRLPKSTAGLVAELERRTRDVARLVEAGALAQVWLSAMGTKTVALALDTHTNALPQRQRTAASAAVKQIVIASWDLDNYGDLGERQKVTDAFNRLTAAVQILKALHAQ